MPASFTTEMKKDNRISPALKYNPLTKYNYNLSPPQTNF